MNQPTERITINPNVCNGRPTIRNMRFTVAQLLELLASGMSEVEFIGDLDPLTEEEALALTGYFADKKKKSLSEKQVVSRKSQRSSLRIVKRLV